MNLTHIKTSECPECGCRVVSVETVETNSQGGIRRHCNGQAWETRKFACEYSVNWSPNFSREETTSECTMSFRAKNQRDKRDKARAVVMTCIDGLDVDQDYKTHLKRCL